MFSRRAVGGGEMIHGGEVVEGEGEVDGGETR